MIRDLGEAAAEIGSSERWLADNLRNGRFPAKKIGRKWMLDDDDIDVLISVLQLVAVRFPI